MRTAAIILAAGASRRLGSPKQLAIVDGERLLERAVCSCVGAQLSPILVILGANAEQIESKCDLGEAMVLHNASWESGASSSIHKGIAALSRTDADATILMTCDMPFVTAQHLHALANLANEEQVNVGSRGKDWNGVPACFLRSSFPELLALEGDAGARKLLTNSPLIDLANGLDIDTAEDLAVANDSVPPKV